MRVKKEREREKKSASRERESIERLEKECV